MPGLLSKGVSMIGAGGKLNKQVRWAIQIFLAGFLFSSCRHLPQQVPVCEVQGEELESPFLDREVILSGLVSGIQDQVEPEGVLIVDQGCSLTGKSSRGIFLQLENPRDLLEVGDEIRVRGWVREQGNETRLEGSSSDLEILSLGNPLPELVDLGEILVPPLQFGYEKWEGQLVAIPLADLQTRQEGAGRDQILPRLSPGSAHQLVCFQTDSFSLGINWDLVGLKPASLQPGSRMENLIGWVRQDGEGYYLQLLQEPRIRVIHGDQQAEGEIPRQPPERAGAGLALSPTRSATFTPASTPTASSTPFPQPSPSPTIIPSPTYYQVQLLISEIYPNPSGDEPGGEWIELYNPGKGWLLLDGIKIGDEISPTGSEGLLRFPDGYYLEGGKTLLIANQAQVFESFYGFLPDFELENTDPLVPDLHSYYRWGRNAIKLSNSGDEVLLLDPWDQVVDLVVYGKDSPDGFAFPVDAPQEGHSLERYPPDQDLDLASDWREQAHPSPGKLDRSTPTPSATVTALVSPSPIINASPPGTYSVSPPPGDPDQSATPVPSTAPGLTSTVPTPSPAGSTPLVPSPTASLSAADPTRTPQATLALTATAGNGAIPSSEPTNTGPLLLINEILADPDPVLGDSNGDGQISSDDDEFLELVNLSGQVLEISGWQVYDGVRLRFTFPEGSQIAPHCGLVLFGGGSPVGGFGGSLIFTAGSLGLNNGGDSVSLHDRNGLEIARVSYGSEGNQDQSLTRNPDLSNQLPLALHGLVQGSSGALFSPGTKVDGSVFGACP